MLTTALMDWATKSVVMAGQSECGDLLVAKVLDDGMLVAVIDGLGHGPAAAMAAKRAAMTIENNARLDLVAIMQHCHSSLSGERGAVISLVRLADNNTLTWLGVGNVEVNLLHNQSSHLLRSVTRPVLRAGLVGQGQLPRLQATSVSIEYNDLVFMVTDGIKPGFTDEIDISGEPGKIAENIISNYAKQTDDALVFVGRYLV
jgi:negative regulator of sigma-B (phosphoserine phosphatase)